MNRMAWAAGVAIVLAGCGGPADSSRLKAGQDATLFADGRDAVTLRTGDGPDGSEPVAMGTRVVVVKDEEPVPDDQKMRDVRVSVTEGPRAGKAGTVRRYELRPR